LLSKLLRFRTLWAYGFDSAARRAPEKSKVGEAKEYMGLRVAKFGRLWNVEAVFYSLLQSKTLK